MAKVKILVQPTGHINLQVWPEAGETMELPDEVAEAMASTGVVEIVKAEKRPASTAKVEKRA